MLSQNTYMYCDLIYFPSFPFTCCHSHRNSSSFCNASQSPPPRPTHSNTVPRPEGFEVSQNHTSSMVGAVFRLSIRILWNSAKVLRPTGSKHLLAEFWRRRLLLNLSLSVSGGSQMAGGLDLSFSLSLSLSVYFHHNEAGTVVLWSSYLPMVAPARNLQQQWQ